MTVDLSELKSGDTVHFRCGGSAEIKEVIKCIGAGYNLIFDDIQYVHTSWDIDGTKQCSQKIFDIIRIEPKPFDWSEVKRGMAFEHVNKSVYRYIGDSLISYDYAVLELLGSSSSFVANKKNLTRAPEYDLDLGGE